MLVGKSDCKTSAVNNYICLAGISQQQIIKFRFFSSTAKKCDATQQKHDTGYGFPAFVPEGENTVAAELIEIPFEDWEAVDRLEGYPRLYDRLMFPAKLEDGTEVSGWVYVMHNLPEMPQVIESGSWKEYRHG